MSETYYYVCDKCGSIVDITETQHKPEDGWMCDNCESTSAWEFTDSKKAEQHAFQIMESLHRQDMARLDEAIKRTENQS